MKGVEIIPLKKVQADERGELFQSENRETPSFLIIKRKSGSVSGKHYHTGKSPLKNPEIVVFLDGEAEFVFRDINSGEKLARVFKEPTLFKISPLIYHEIRAITDIIFIDLNTSEDAKDVVAGSC